MDTEANTAMPAEMPASPMQDEKSLQGLARRITSQAKLLAEKDAEIAALKAEFGKAQTTAQAQSNIIEQAVSDVEGRRDKDQEIADLQQRVARAEALARVNGDPVAKELLAVGVPADRITTEFLAAIRQGASEAGEFDSGPVPFRFSRSVGPAKESLEELTRNFRPGDYNALFDGAPS